MNPPRRYLPDLQDDLDDARRLLQGLASAAILLILGVMLGIALFGT